MLLKNSEENSVDARTRKSVWDPQAAWSKEAMNARIKNALASPGWQETIRILASRDIPINRLNIAEVGCGTGTFALTFGLLGASVTLIDFNNKALEQAQNIYTMFDCRARLINADCLDAPPAEIQGFFDVVISSGLLEHFTGENRKQCLRYHELLLKKDGFAVIVVPNAHSPWYRFIMLFRKITKTWNIDLEVPLSAKELKMLAKKTGFVSTYVIPNAGAWNDFKYYAWGFISALTDLFPKRIKDGLKKYRDNLWNHPGCAFSTDEDMRGYCVHRVGSLNKDTLRQTAKVKLFDRLSSVLALFAFKGTECVDV